MFEYLTYINKAWWRENNQHDWITYPSNRFIFNANCNPLQVDNIFVIRPNLPHGFCFIHQRRHLIHISFAWLRICISAPICTPYDRIIGHSICLDCDFPTIKKINKTVLKDIIALLIIYSKTEMSNKVIQSTYTAFPLWKSPWWTVPYWPCPNICFFSIECSE